MKKLIFYIAIGVFFISCEKTLKLDAETKSSKLVVNSLFADNEMLNVSVSRSLSVLDAGNLSGVGFATVKLFDEDNNFIEALNNLGDGSFSSSSPSLISSGKKYKIEVSALNYNSVSAEDVCPSAVAVLSIDTSHIINSFGEQEYTATINFQDPANTENYYGIEVEVSSYTRFYNSFTGQYDTTLDYNNNLYLTSRDPIVDNGGSDSYSQILTFKDNLFDGQQKSVTLSYYLYHSGSSDQFHTTKLRLYSYSEASYNYSKSIEAYREVEGNPFAEPVQVFTNIEGGFGIFGGQSVYEIDY